MSDLASIAPSAATPGLFPRKRLIRTVVIASLAFLLAILAGIFADEQKVAAPDATPFSESAIGHKALMTFLEKVKLPSGFAMLDVLGFAGVEQLSVLLEPDPEAIAPVDLPRRMTAKTVLLVLPKWVAKADEDKPRWVEGVAYMERAAVTEVLRSAVPDGTLVRLPGQTLFNQNDYKLAPYLPAAQLMRSSKLKPLIAGPDGILLGSIKSGKSTIYVLSDPDLLNNHGLDDASNAALTYSILTTLRGKGGVDFDYGIYKYKGARSLWRQLVSPPALGPLLLALAALAVLMWQATTDCAAAGRRQARPHPQQRRAV